MKDETRSKTSPTIMVVASDRQLTEFIRTHVGKYDCEVIETDKSGAELIDTLSDTGVDLVVVDMAQAARGLEVMLQIRECSSVPTVLLSMWRGGKTRVRMFDVNSVDYLGQPVEAGEFMAWLTGRLHEIINLKRTEIKAS